MFFYVFLTSYESHKVIAKVITFSYYGYVRNLVDDEGIMKKEKKSITPMEHFNMSDFLRGQASRIITSISNEDKAGFVLKNGKPIAVLISNDRYERLLQNGIDINEY